MNKIIDYKLNIIATVVCVPYFMFLGFTTSPTDNSILHQITKDYSELVSFFVYLIYFSLAIILWMFTFRWLYNKIATTLYGLRTINLAEAYALSLVVCVVTARG